MVIAFNDSASVVQSYTSNRQLLRERINRFRRHSARQTCERP